MPTQSRGFWSCDFCRATFDLFEEAKFHEAEQCQHRPAAEQQRTPAHSSEARGHYSATMAPMSASVQKQQVLDDYEAERRDKPTVIPLMTPHEVSEMNESDNVASQNLEVFEASSEHVADVDLRSSEGPLEIGQVGLRCIHCANNPLTVAKNGISFPHCIEDVGESVHKLASMHLSHCGMTPTPVREISQQAAGKRRRADIERGALWQEVNNSRATLREYCVQFCQRYGIVNKSAAKTGIIFSASRGGAATPRQITMSSAERHGARSVPGPSMMGPTGNDPLAPTPLARRRDRPREVMEHPYSAERSGYETPYGHGPPPEVGYYEAITDAAGTHTPSHVAHRPEEGPESAHQTPMAAQPPEASPQAGYQPPPTPYELPSNFPFYQEPNGSWCCKYCSHIHPQYRDPYSVWSSPTQAPPPGHFIDQHLSKCRGYHQSMPPQHMYQGPPPPYPPYMGPQYHMSYGPPHAGWEHSGPGQPTPGHPPQHMHYAHPHGGDLPPPPLPPYPHTPHQMPPKYMEGGPRTGMIPPTRTPLPAGGTPRPEAGESAVRHAIEYLSASDKKELHTPGERNSTDDQLVLDEDRLLLTDYFFYLMKQLRLCRFSESDRKTRGGKREKIRIGFGGLQCIHCSEASNSRKFFWSNVDRLANSFAEIPGHVLKCRHCPQQAKDALFQLKQLHPEQMARLPRGSQKVFFRRMWRRLHDEDPEQPSAPEEAKSESKVAKDVPEGTKPGEILEKTTPIQPKVKTDISPSGTAGSGSDESALLLQRPTKEAAKALADSASLAAPPSPSSRVLLSIPEDKEWLSDTDCFIRRQVEVFCATREDVATARSDRKYPVHEGQVGIRCIHCALSKGGPGACGSAVAFPFSISGIYESVREFQRLHLDTCENLPKDVKSRLSGLKGSTSLSSVLRKYYVLAAKALGLKDTRDGIRSGGESVPLGSQAAFAFSEGNALSTMSDEMHRPSGSYSDLSPAVTPLESRKRKSMDKEQPHSSEGSKKAYSEYK